MAGLLSSLGFLAVAIHDFFTLLQIVMLIACWFESWYYFWGSSGDERYLPPLYGFIWWFTFAFLFCVEAKLCPCECCCNRRRRRSLASAKNSKISAPLANDPTNQSDIIVPVNTNSVTPVAIGSTKEDASPKEEISLNIEGTHTAPTNGSTAENSADYSEANKTCCLCCPPPCRDGCNFAAFWFKRLLNLGQFFGGVPDKEKFAGTRDYEIGMKMSKWFQGSNFFNFVLPFCLIVISLAQSRWVTFILVHVGMLALYHWWNDKSVVRIPSGKNYADAVSMLVDNSRSYYGSNRIYFSLYLISSTDRNVSYNFSN